MLRNCLFFISVFLLISCKNNKKEASDIFEFKESINLPLSENSTHQGHFIDKGKDFFYSYNLNTNNLFIYDKQKVIDSVNLSYASANQMIVKNLDSIFVIDYTNRLLKQLNFKNENIKTIDFYKVTEQDTLNAYLFNEKNSSIDVNNMLLSLAYTDSNSKKKLTEEEFLNHYHQSPIIGLLNNDTFFYSDLSFNDVKKISGKNPNISYSSYSGVTISDDYIVLNMKFFNQLYIFDKKLNFIKTVPITSKYTGTNINTDYSVSNDESPEIKDYEYATLTQDIVYDKVNSLYYVLLIHKTDINNPAKLIEKRSNRPFSILVYNKNFDLINEQVFKKNLYEIYQLSPLNISSKGELIINASNSMNPKYSKKHLQYDLYKVKSDL